MSDFFRPTPVDIYVAQHDGFNRFVDIEMPSLRVVHDFQLEEFRFGYAGFHSRRFFWIRPGGGRVDPRVRDVGKQWAEMFNATLSPGYISKFVGRISPLHQLPLDLRPVYLASAAVLISDWPLNRDILDCDTECATLTVKIRQGAEKVDITPEVSMAGELFLSRGRMPANRLLKKVDDHWSHLCDKIGPWLADSGISYLEIVMPVNFPKRQCRIDPPSLT